MVIESNLLLIGIAIVVLYFILKLGNKIMRRISSLVFLVFTILRIASMLGINTKLF